MKKVLQFFNPMAHLGERRYSILFPLVTMLLFCLLSEGFAYGIAKDPMVVSMYAIFVPVALIIYFAFREGIGGGITAVGVTIIYYFYIIYTRHYSGQMFDSGIETTVTLLVVYLLLAGIIGWLKQRIDILLEREADEKRRLEAIIQQLPVGVIITDSQGRVTQRNQMVDKILGVKIPLGFKMGADTITSATIDKKPINPTRAPLVQALTTGRPVIGKEYEYSRTDKKTLYLQVDSAPIHNKQKKMIAAASIIADITSQKELQRQKDDFLGIASHELKTPVTSIKAYGQVLKRMYEKKGDTQAVTQLNKMDAQINKLTNLIGDLLDVTKLQTGRMEFHRDTFELNELIREVSDEVQLTTEKHQIVNKLARTTKLYADRERLGQVFINFLTNAIKYSPDGTKIIVKTTRTAKGISVCVQDFGVGIPHEVQQKVFEQFFRVTGPKENTFPGLGLGLYISSQIIKREGGRIWVESTEGKGSTFCFSLPIRRVHQPARVRKQ